MMQQDPLMAKFMQANMNRAATQTPQGFFGMPGPTMIPQMAATGVPNSPYMTVAPQAPVLPQPQVSAATAGMQGNAPGTAPQTSPYAAILQQYGINPAMLQNLRLF